MKPISALLSFLMVSLLGQAQSGDILENYVQQAIESSEKLLQQQISIQQQQNDISASKGLFAPQLSFQANYTLASGGRQIEFPIGDLLNPVYGTLNQLTESNSFPTDLKNEEIQFLPNNFQETKLRLIQPIFNSDLYYNYKAQQNLLLVEEAQLNAYKLELAFTVRTAYYNYLRSLEGVKIYETNLNTLTKLLATNRKLVAEGQQSPEVVYRTLTEINQLKTALVQAKENEMNALNYFNFLMSRGLESTVEIDSSFSVLAQTGYSNSSSNARPEIDMLHAAQMAQANNVSRLSAQKLPSVNAVVDAGYQGFGYDLNEQEFVLMQVGLQWNLFQGNSRRKEQANAALALEQLHSQETQLKQQIALQVALAQQQYSRAQQQYALQQKSVEQARKTYQIMSKKYNEGQVLLIEVLDARNTYLSEQQALVLSKYQIPMAQAAIQRALAL